MKRTTDTKADVLSMRLQGKRPVVKIAGKAYTFYIEDSALRPFGHAGSTITLDPSDKSGKSHRFLFNPRTGETPAKIDGDCLEFPRDLLIVELPPPVALDPVGFAWEHGIKIKDILRLYPCKLKWTARIIPWQKTRFTRLIEENNWAMERRKKEQESAATGNKTARRKGEGL